MKKKCWFLLFLILQFSSTIYSQTPPTTTDVRIDQRLELFTIIAYLGGHLSTPVPSDYTASVDKHFSRFKKHPAVKAVSEIMNEKNIESTFPMLAFYFDDITSMNQILPITDSITLSKIDTQNFKNFATLAKDFAIKSEFDLFYNDELVHFNKWRANVWNTLLTHQLIKKLSNFYGTKKSVTICLSPLSIREVQLFSPSRQFTDSCIFLRFGYSTFINGYSSKKNSPIFNEKVKLESLIWQEGGSTFMNPIIEKHIDELNPARKIFTPAMEATLQKASGQQWTFENFLKEQLVRAATAYLLRIHESVELGDREISKQENLGFPYTRELVNVFSNYDNERNHYPFIESITPDIIRFFNEKHVE